MRINESTLGDALKAGFVKLSHAIENKKRKGESHLDALKRYVKKWAKQLKNIDDERVKKQLANEMILFLNDRRNYEDWDHLAQNIEDILQKSGMDPDNAEDAILSLRSGVPMREEAVTITSMIFEEAGYSWEQAGLDIRKYKSDIIVEAAKD